MIDIIATTIFFIGLYYKVYKDKIKEHNFGKM